MTDNEPGLVNETPDERDADFLHGLSLALTEIGKDFAAARVMEISLRLDARTEQLAERDATIARLREAMCAAKQRFEALCNFGDPDEIADDPESFGGTDDGDETVRMAYENMQFIANRGLAELRAALTEKEG